MTTIENENPNVYKKCAQRELTSADEDDNVVDPFDDREIFGEYYNVDIVSQTSVILYSLS